MNPTFRYGFILILLLMTIPAWGYDWILDSRPIVLLKEYNHDLEAVRSYLSLKATDGRANIWVFFTDKGVFDKDGYDLRAASVFLTEKALTRRAKVGRQIITFGDLPVLSSYIETIEDMGGMLRRRSRWLNAASFSIPLNMLNEINRLPFVRKIQPVAIYRRSNEPVIRSFVAPSPSVLGGSTLLDYGHSLGQLAMINVPAIHERGFNGQGVLVALFDTGFRKDHGAFAAAYASGRVLAEWDFIFNDGNTQNEAEDIDLQHRHGTLTWSTLGGAVEGVLYGPAYGASFILAKTEDERSETMIEEDNWVAAVEWVDSIGADVISSSVGYIDWYTYNDLDGQTAVTTIAADLAVSYGIVVVNSAGNEGTAVGSIIAPADAFDIISVGAVSADRFISSFSSCGPTYDGRIKPEVCAQGVSTYCAYFADTNTYATASGTSLSCPLVAGAAAVLLSARPELTPQNVRRALMETADQAENPNNTYGWGIIDLEAAFNWGVLFAADSTIGQVPLEVRFFDSSAVAVTDRSWDFGDGTTSIEVNPVHSYDVPGIYNVTLTVGTALGDLVKNKPAYIIALADTITYGSDTVYAGESSRIDLVLTNSQPLRYLRLPIDFSDGALMILDSVSNSGTRTAAFSLAETASNPSGTKRVFVLGNGSVPLPPGSGSVLTLYFHTNRYAMAVSRTVIDTGTVSSQGLRLFANQVSYQPIVRPGEIRTRSVTRGDANNDGVVNVGDPVYLLLYVFRGGPGPRTIESGDANTDFTVNAGDAVFLIDYIFRGGVSPIDD